MRQRSLFLVFHCFFFLFCFLVFTTFSLYHSRSITRNLCCGKHFSLGMYDRHISNFFDYLFYQYCLSFLPINTISISVLFPLDRYFIFNAKIGIRRIIKIVNQTEEKEAPDSSFALIRALQCCISFFSRDFLLF